MTSHAWHQRCLLAGEDQATARARHLTASLNLGAGRRRARGDGNPGWLSDNLSLSGHRILTPESTRVRALRRLDAWEASRRPGATLGGRGDGGFRRARATPLPQYIGPGHVHG
ncbi:uncharacterized protein SCHCODRAFT_02506481 [Schizophyllum commune H4-8]|uniref:uncharacterized protein n=1 Tax=Schizophyllum commune (strain H4-8 / FGSC 9210) TaxID=578458 RepID=UPI00215E730E|nr:uncharacterized protein SCHCODRAFT_02506481 [Schizophyllum commune H4-8]KAI5890967.1 hypothetical protein SCHCODRAFT_02506481 [Schizophyllum commune H4-8]